MTKGTEVKYIQIERGPFTNLTDVPTTYSGEANKFVVVSSGSNGLVFITSAKITVGTSAPASPNVGDLWVDTN
jgi:hypothetical protein